MHLNNGCLPRLKKVGLFIYWIGSVAFTPDLFHTRVSMEPFPDHRFSWVLVRLFHVHQNSLAVIHTCTKRLNQGRK